MNAMWKKYSLKFKQPSGTSRGILRHKESYFIILEKEDKTGIGECGLLRGLSADDRPGYESKLDWLCAQVDDGLDFLYDKLKEWPSIQFGLEQAFLDIQSDDHLLFPSKFTSGESHQPINGLIWMGDSAFMRNQVREKVKGGFSVLKMKVGAIKFEEEIAILKEIRSDFSARELELRVDANGAFSREKAPETLNRLADLQIHSIEQPIKQGQWQEMAALCESSPIPIALDEELIGLFDRTRREEMLKTVQPQFLILKPSFIGGFRGTMEWIELAKSAGIGYWLTSALESNIGLNAITQFNFTLENPIPSGLGTGGLYSNNFDSPLFVQNGEIGFDPSENFDLAKLMD